MFLICFEDSYAYVNDITDDDMSDWASRNYDVIDMSTDTPRKINAKGEWESIAKALRQIVEPM
jgi:hypothetical protein